MNRAAYAVVTNTKLTNKQPFIHKIIFKLSPVLGKMH